MNIVITGTSKGLGFDTLQILCKDHRVISLSRNIRDLQESDNYHLIETDINEYESVKKSFQDIGEKFGSIDILINNAAIFKMSPLIDMDISDINNIIDTNLKGTIYCTYECLKLMNSGRIININSVSGLSGIKDQSVYSSSKSGLIGFMDSLAQELKHIKITNIFPGGIDTTLWSKHNYPGDDYDRLLKTSDIIDVIKLIINLKENVVIKNLTIFPDNEWH